MNDTSTRTYEAAAAELDDITAALHAMHERQRASDRLAEAMVERALAGAEISALDRFLLFSAVRHCLTWELSRDAVRRIGEASQ